MRISGNSYEIKKEKRENRWEQTENEEKIGVGDGGGRRDVLRNEQHSARLMIRHNQLDKYSNGTCFVNLKACNFSRRHNALLFDASP